MEMIGTKHDADPATADRHRAFSARIRLRSGEESDVTIILTHADNPLITAAIGDPMWDEMRGKLMSTLNPAYRSHDDRRKGIELVSMREMEPVTAND